MRVHPNVQRRRYGQQMLKYLEARAIASGYRVLHLHTTTLQAPAQSLNAMSGYVKVDRKP